MAAALQRLASAWKEADSAERDQGFRSLIEDASARGLRSGGAAGLVALVLYVLSHVLAGRSIALTWTSKAYVVLWDKLAIGVGLGLLILATSTRFGRARGRELAIAAVLGIAVASASDDWMNADMTFTAAWVVLFLVAAAGILPLSPRQVLSLSLLLLTGLITALFLAPAAYSDGSLRTQGIFFGAVVLIVNVVSFNLYLTRFRLYRAARENSDLALENERRARHIAEIESLKSRFFAGVTHDLRTPLALVVGPLEDALQGAEDLPPAVRTHLDIARRNASHLASLADDLVDLSHIDSGKLVLHRAPYDLAEMCSLIALDLQPLAEKRRVTLRCEGPEPGPTCSVDPARIEQSVSNLLSNALNFTPAGGSVTLAVNTGADGLAWIDIADTGPGLPKDVLSDLFNRFPSSEAGRVGHGLGLAIAHEFVQMHDGTLEVLTTGPSGTTFRIGLPVVPDAPYPLPSRLVRLPASSESIGETSPGAVAGSGNDPVVLVVDDNPDMRAYLSLHLADRYRIIEATNGDDALSIIRESSPDLVLADIVMPGIDGIRLCREVRSGDGSSTTPIVLMTASSDPALHLRGLEAGADDVLEKPFGTDALLARLENLVELRRMLATGVPSGTVPMGPTPVFVASTEAVFVGKVREIVERHLGDGNFGVDWLADEVGLSTRQLQRRLRDATRLSAAGYIRMLRLGRAADLLRSGARNVSEAAWDVGFRDADHFASLFRQAYGVPPSEYARAARDPSAAPDCAPTP